MTVGVIGIGLIGGSFALALKEAGHKILGYDKSREHCRKALDLGLVDEIIPTEKLCAKCDLLFICVPVDAAAGVLNDVLDHIGETQIVIDTGSTKASICDSIRSHVRRGRFVACHPLAGTEFSGPTAAKNDLFRTKKNIICEEHLTDEDALDSAIALFESLMIQTIFMDPGAHDRHMAYVSHLSHISSFMLGSTVLDIEKDEKQIFNLASTGFASTVRLAKSSPETWSAIFEDNSKNILQALEAYIAQLEEIKSAIQQRDTKRITEILRSSNDIKRVLNGMKYNIVKLS